MKSICVFASNGLGDGLLSLVLGRNLQRLGHKVTLISSPLMALRSWIPWAEIKPFMSAEEMDAALRPFDHVIAADHSRALGKGEVVYLDRSQSVVQSFENYLQSKWGSVQPIGAPDLAIPSIYQYQRHDKRIVIHPTSGHEQRNWPAEKFLALAIRLQAEGFDPVFMMSPAEAKEWADLENKVPLAVFPDLSDAAGYMYESKYFIGNDSGLVIWPRCFEFPPCLYLHVQAMRASGPQPGAAESSRQPP